MACRLPPTCPCMPEAPMTRRTVGFFVTLAFTLLVALCAAPAPPAGKVPRIGFLISSGRPPPACSQSGSTSADFVRRLHELGYVEGQTILIEWRCAELNAERAHH